MHDTVKLLTAQWRTEADTLRKRGAVAQAVAVESCAEELERALLERDDELLNLTEAARLSGYSSEHLGRMVRDGKIPNAGRPGAPRIRLGDLPRRPRPAVARSVPGAYDPIADARKLGSRRKGGEDAFSQNSA